MNRIGITVFVLMTSLGCHAQRGSFDPDKMARDQTEKMIETLDLNDGQITKVTSLNDQYALRIKTSRERANGDRSTMMKLMKDVQTEKDQELIKIFTADQWELWLAEREQLRQKRKGRRN